MKLDRKVLKKNAKHSLKKHYFLFVIIILFGAMIGIGYQSSTSLFSSLRTNSEDIADEIANDAALLQEDPSGTINNKLNNTADAVNSVVDNPSDAISGTVNGSSYITSYAIADAIINLIEGNSVAEQDDEALIEEANKSKQDISYGFLTVGYREGVLASFVNTFSSGSYLLSAFKAIMKVVKNPSASTIIFLLLGAVIALAYSAFIKNFVRITSARSFLEGQHYDKVHPRTFLYLFRTRGFFRACWTLFVKRIMWLLWCLTIVGGVIKFFSYSQTTFILAENPNLNTKEAVTLSRKMMQGHKWELFVLYLSFIPWQLLNMVTFGLTGLFFLNPYIEATLTQFYLGLRQQTIDNKIEGYELLNDIYLVEYATEDELSTAYADMVELYKSNPDAPEKFTGITGFFANVFGIVLYYSDKVKRINAQEKQELLIKNFEAIHNNKAYPERLQPSAVYKKAPKPKALHYLRRYSVTSIVVLFFSGCIVGWLWEVALHIIEDGVFVNRGVLHGPWLPIYGVGCIMIVIVLYKARTKPWLEFLLSILLCGVVEYFASWLLEKTQNGQKWWDYTGYFLNINGRVCAEGLLVFGIAGMACVYFMAPLIDNLVQKISLKILIPVCAVLLIIFAIDNVYSKSHPNTGKGITDYDTPKQTGSIDVNSATEINQYQFDTYQQQA